MYVPSDEIGFKIYWKDNSGEKRLIHTSDRSMENAVNDIIVYIRERLYMDNFSIVGVEQLEGGKWVKQPFSSISCKGSLYQ